MNNGTRYLYQQTILPLVKRRNSISVMVMLCALALAGCETTQSSPAQPLANDTQSDSLVRCIAQLKLVSDMLDQEQPVYDNTVMKEQIERLSKQLITTSSLPSPAAAADFNYADIDACFNFDIFESDIIIPLRLLDQQDPQAIEADIWTCVDAASGYITFATYRGLDISQRLFALEQLFARAFYAQIVFYRFTQHDDDEKVVLTKIYSQLGDAMIGANARAHNSNRFSYEAHDAALKRCADVGILEDAILRDVFEQLRGTTPETSEEVLTQTEDAR